MSILNHIHRTTIIVAMSAPFAQRVCAAELDNPPGSQYEIVVADAPDSERKPGDAPEQDMIVDGEGHRAPLKTARGNANGEYTFSPDEHWLYGSYHVGSGLSAGELFAHGQGARFTALRKDREFSDLAWEFCVRQGAVASKDVSPDVAARLIGLGVWSPDSSRLLVSLCGGEKHGRGVYDWNVYWNTRTSAFELTDYLRALNQEATRRWSDDDTRAKFAPAACAEPLPGHWPAATKLKALLADADRELNTAYAAKIAKLNAPGQKTWRAGQREWIKHRDEGAGVYASFGADPGEREQRRLQYTAEATRQRTVVLQSE